MTRRQALCLLPFTAAAQTTPTAFLNHFYATVDTPTYVAIDRSDFLHSRFAPFEKRTTVRNDSTYSGLYLYGTDTYFEFFEANTGDRKAGDAGLALGLETPSGTEWLKSRWQTLSPSIISTVTRQLDGQPLDWFAMTSFEETRAASAVEGFRLFSMQYSPAFVSRWLNQNPLKPTLRRADVLAAYCTRLKLESTRKSSLLDNVQTLEIAGPESNLRRRAAQLTAAGWAQSNQPGALLLNGPSFQLTLRFAAKIEGVRRATFSLKQSFSHSETIGNSQLVFTNRTATWTLP